MNKDDVAGLVREATLDARAFRKHVVYDSEGEPLKLTENAKRLDRYSDALTTLSAENERLKSLLQASLNSKTLGTGDRKGVISAALRIEIEEALADALEKHHD